VLNEVKKSDWTFENNVVESLPEDCVGFVYLITNTVTGKKYIGKKLAKFAKTSYKVVKLKNGTKKKKKIRSKVESDWKDYFGSNDKLNEDVTSLGKENFTREILRYCKSKTELSYYESKYQFDCDVLLDESIWYNGWISVKVRRFKL
jgi:hypothetical protein